MIGHEINELDTFIKGWYIEDLSMCDGIIQYFNNNNNKRVGTVHSAREQNKKVVNKTAKDSTDCELSELFLRKEYIKNLQKCVDMYIDTFVYCNTGYPWTIVEPINVQHYAPGGGYHDWHYERAVSDCEQANRHLVFMTYLNDVNDGGETDFFYQKIKVKPRKGLTLIWPADWTYTHKGILSNTEEKYIVTGWFNYYRG